MPFYIMFIDLKNAFDTVSRTGLYKVLEKITCLSKLLQMICALHDIMTARITSDGDISEPFNLRCGVKQGCDGTYPIWYLCIHPTLPCLSITRLNSLHTRHDGNLINLAHLRAKPKTDTVLICELMFVDDVAFYTHSLPKLQEMYDAFNASCDLFGLEISTKKTVKFATNGPPPWNQISGE